MKVYINSEEVCSVSTLGAPAGLAGSSENLYIGRRGIDSVQSYSGKIGSLRFYSGNDDTIPKTNYDATKDMYAESIKLPVTHKLSLDRTGVDNFQNNDASVAAENDGDPVGYVIDHSKNGGPSNVYGGDFFNSADNSSGVEQFLERMC